MEEYIINKECIKIHYIFFSVECDLSSKRFVLLLLANNGIIIK